MSQYDDDAERLGDICDGCGQPFAICDCSEMDYYDPDPADCDDAEIGGEG